MLYSPYPYKDASCLSKTAPALNGFPIKMLRERHPERSEGAL